MPTKERHRSTLACARCYQIKKRCDKNSPSCSRCVQARQICTGLNRQKDAEVPRSIVKYLEDTLMRLQSCSSDTLPMTTNGLPDGHNTQDSVLDFQRGTETDVLCHYSYMIQLLRVMMQPRSATALIDAHPGLHHRNRLFYGSEAPPLKIHLGIHDEKPYRISGSFSKAKAPRREALIVPHAVAMRLLQVYIENILPRYPCYLESELERHFNDIYSDDPTQKCFRKYDISRFIISMILAISSLTSKAQDFRKVANLSESLHRDALRHCQFLCNSNSDTLKCFLLLIQLALLLPHTGNLWYMTGEAMRMAIALGLHQEPVEPLALEQADLRRRIFWTTYILERTVCIASGCPVAISDEHIKIPLPFGCRDNLYQSNCGSDDDSRYRETQFLNIIRLRQLQTEIQAIQFFGRQLPDSAVDYDTWVEMTDKEIRECENHALTGRKVVPDWYVNAVQVTRLMLHRPCLRNNTPSDPSILEVVRTAIDFINSSWKISHTGYLIFPLHNVYNGFHAGIVLLYALRYRPELHQSRDLYEQVLAALNLLTQTFTALAGRWPAAAKTGFYFNELREGVIRNIEAGLDPNSTEYVNLIAELDHLVTERQLPGLYQRSTAPANFQSLDNTYSPEWIDTQFPLGTDETWDDFMNMGFIFEDANVNALYNAGGTDHLVSSAPGLQAPNLLPIANEGRNEATSVEKLDHIMDSIPACSYCRNRRVKCDRRLPTCHLCAEARRSCLYYDAVLSKDVPGSYIHTLYTNIKNMMSQEMAGETAGPDHLPAASARASKSSRPRNIFLPSGQKLWADQSSNVRAPNTDSMFFGSCSPVAILDLATSARPDCAQYQLSTTEASPNVPLEISNDQISIEKIYLPSQSSAETLVNIFSESINIFYPTIQRHELDKLLLTAYQAPADIHNTFEEQTLYFIFAIASHLAKGSKRYSIFTSNAYFRQGIANDSIMHEKTSTSQLLLLQRSLLICIYILLSPESGDIWRNLGFSVRLYFDIVHRPSQLDEEGQQLALMLYRTLYCLESQVAVAYGRPSLLAIYDVLHDDMLNVRSGTLPEIISARFYHIAYLKLQLLQDVLSGNVSRTEPQNSASDKSHRHFERLQAWYTEWNQQVEMFGSPNGDDNCLNDTNSAQLKAWGDFQYHETIVFLSRNSNTSPNEDPTITTQRIIECNSFIQACTSLSRYQLAFGRSLRVSQTSRSSFQYCFPITWTISHGVFAAGLSLLQEGRFLGSIDGEKSRSGALRRCLTLMASLEANADNMVSGCTDILESICNYDEER